MSETQHYVHNEQENIQTASDIGLFKDNNMEGAESRTSQLDTAQYRVSEEASRMDFEEPLNDVTGQSSTWTTQLHKRGTSRMDLDDVASQTRTALPDKREKRAAHSVLPDKRRIKEVDYSETLHQTVYSQGELIHNMQTQVENQKAEHEQNMNEMKRQWETTLREQQEQLAEAQEEIERTRVQQHLLEEHIKETREGLGQANQEAINAVMHKIQQDARDHLVQAQIQQEAELRENLARREQELKRQTNEEAEKESEVAKMEWRFSRCRGPQNEDIDMNNPTMPGDAGQPSSPYAKSRSGTLCYDAIKRIKKTRGMSHRVRLVSVVSEVDEEEIPREQSSEQDAPPHLQHDTHPATAMEDAIARGVEAALRRVLIDKEFPVTKKHSPRRRKMEKKELQQEKAAEKNYERDFLLGEVRRLFKDIFNISQDADFILHQAASREDVYVYEYEDGPGPNCQDLAFDLTCGLKSPWNDKVMACSLQNCREGVWKRAGCSEVWTAAQPKVTAKGGLETPAEVEQRLITKKDGTLKATRQTTRRKNKYLRRVTVLNHLVGYKADENEEDLPAWKWLQQLVGTLGEGGMSSEESDIENDIETVLRVKNMTWC
ncbi:hypothetical protein F4604DRAFT_1687571 [Suillus subluteus]|nr:hypothetical protein F4604DRAFT_1687571 [Suillus subluteus]